jgi:tetratricopeptide (TPR) repeat protein/transglutaminase-like putative cysteine protease
MRFLSALLLFLSLGCLAIAAQTSAASPADSPKIAKSPSKDYSQESYVVEQVTTRFRFENDGTGRKEVVARIHVQSEAGVEQWGQVVVGYNSANERVEIPYVRVRKQDGTVVTAPADSVQDLSAPLEHEAPVYTDYRQKHITVPGLRPGETLEYDLVTVIHTPLAPGQFWTDYSFEKNGIVLDEQLDIDVPADRSVKLKNKPGLDPKVSDAAGRRVYHWSATHLEREDDDKNPDKKKKKKKKDDDLPAVQMTTFTSWEAVGSWYASLERDRRQPSADIRAKADELTKGSTTDLAKIEALYDYVAKNFRYVSLSLGVGRYQPHAAADVFHNQYGDCKDKHTLLASMLAAEGFQASSVLINSSRKLDPDVPSPAQFDHVITLLPLGKEEVWMDTTTEVAPFRLLSFNIRKKQALVIPASGPAHLEETPADPPFPNRQLQTIDATVNDLGKIQAHVTFDVRGDTELLMRMIFRRVPNAQWQHLVETMNNAAGLDGDISNLKVSDPAETRQPFVFSYDLSKANYLDWSKKKSELDLPLAQFSLNDADEDDTGPDAEPIQFGPPGTYVYRLKIVLPSKDAIRGPLPFNMKRDYAEYSAVYKIDGSTFTAERTLTMRERELPAARTSDYLAFRRAVGSDLGQRLSIESTVAGTPAPPSGMKADELDESGRAAMRSGNLPLAIELLKRAVEVDPKHKYAWNNLGLAYLAVRQNDDAIAAFQKATEVNPYDEFAFNNLGRAYWQERKYDEAARAFRKQLEVNPLDKFAYGNLGQMYSEWHKYDEAAPELEKAVSLNPDDPGLEVSLGDAYLNLGQDDKAMAAFDRAVSLSASPLVWNNIAYQLSLRGAHLDKAQQYAESAVAATAAALRNLSLDQLNQRDLGLMPSLIAYWDTLGWVYFARGDFNKAERYVSAAWQLGHHGEVGDHLGQIYEKRGDKEKAIQTYSEAMSGLRPSLDTYNRLTAVLGNKDQVTDSVKKYRPTLDDTLTIPLGKLGTTTGSAEYFVLLAGDQQKVAVDNLKFVGGDEKMRVYEDAIRHIRWNLNLPDDTPTRILRRGILFCSASTGNCNFILSLPDDVRSVDFEAPADRQATPTK